MRIKSILGTVFGKYCNRPVVIQNNYYKRYRKYAFSEKTCQDAVQFEAAITKLYHSVEKGLTYQDFRPGFGKKNLDSLLNLMEMYANKFSTDAFFYRTALCVLRQYVVKNQEYGWSDEEINLRISRLPGNANDAGGVITVTRPDVKLLCFEDFAYSRHSLRSFGEQPVNLDAVKKAVTLAQQTPSACNRQGWRTRIVTTPDKIQELLKNQNGNKGFGDNIPVLLVVTADLRCFARGREHYQAFIDGGMYAMELLHCLHFGELATVPLSASLRPDQEKAVRKILGLDPSEVLIMFIGVGNYPEQALTTRSERKPVPIEVL